MGSLYRIGEFARLSGVSAKALRFYDRIGLFRPAVTDARTNYRFYAPHQLREIGFILTLRNLGSSLTDIRQSLTGVEAGDRQQVLLRELRLATERSLWQSTRSLELIDRALEQLRGFQPKIPVTVKRLRACPVASVRARVGSYVEIEVIERTLRGALPPASIGDVRGAVWHRCEDSSVLEGEAFVGLTAKVPTRRFYDVTQLPASTLACAYSLTDDTSAARTYEALTDWMTTNGYRLTGPKRELYWGSMLEIQYPVAPRAS